ncbi:MAG: cytochrome c [Proteobacteria bacterium]|nr:cytochrome c [Pseudomonadota bacterium]
MKLPGALSRLFVGAVLVGGAAIVLYEIFGPAGSGAIVRVTVPELSAAARTGKAVFDANCAVCHGVNAAGTRNGPPLVHDTYNPGHHDDDAFFRAAATGSQQHHWTFGDMPPQPQVSRREVASVIRYVRELQLANGITYRPHRM